MGDVDKADIVSVIAAVEDILDDNGFRFEKGLASSTAAKILHTI